MADRKADEPNSKKKKKEKDPPYHLTFAVIDNYRTIMELLFDRMQTIYSVCRNQYVRHYFTLPQVRMTTITPSLLQVPPAGVTRVNRDLATGESTYKPGSGLPVETRKLLAPIYNERSSEELLRVSPREDTESE